MAFATIAQIKAANRAAGNHFFDADTMEFFRSRVEGGVIGGRFFITSEQFDDAAPRRFTIREAREDGSIETAGEFQSYATREEAASTIQQSNLA